MNWEKFMLESNRIEGEDRINPGDKAAFDFAMGGIDNLQDIMDLHQLLGGYLNENWVGRLRTCNVFVGSYKPPTHQKIYGLMMKYGENIISMESWEAHNEFERIHPFQDLNGRVGRLIWLSKAVNEGYKHRIPFLQMYYYQTLEQYEKIKTKKKIRQKKVKR